jgi:hypothetical protein
MELEVRQHNQKRNWRPILRNLVPLGKRILPSLWAMRRERYLVNGIISKYKARLNVDGSKQIQGIDYNETFAPVT